MIPSESMPLFCQSSHPLLRRAAMPLPEYWQFEAGESVWISSPNGSELIPATIVQTDTADGIQSRLFILDVKPGHYMEIVAGVHTGRNSFVVEALLSIAPGRFCSEPI